MQSGQVLSVILLVCIPSCWSLGQSFGTIDSAQTQVSAPAVVASSAPVGSAPQLSPDAVQVAEQIGVSSLLTRLRTLSAEKPPASGINYEELVMRQDIYNAVLAASLDVDSVAAEIESERSRLTEIRSTLELHRDKAVNATGLANILIGTGVGIVGTAMQFSSSTAQLGNGIGVGAGSASTILQLYGLRQQGGGQISVGRAPNMLAPLFARTAQLHAEYPPDVWSYLNSAPAGQKATRLAQLKSEWVSSGRISASQSAAASQKIDLLTTSMDSRRKLGIDVLTDRDAMLADVLGRVTLMKRDLAELLRSLRSRQ